MKLFELVNPDKLDLEKFERDCQPFLNELRGSGSFPWHGSKRTELELGTWAIQKMTYRHSPRDTNRDVHDDINEFFSKHFGGPARNWLFITGSFSVARQYGTPFMIFPIGKYKYLWSPEIEDLTLELQRFKDEQRVMDASIPFDEREKKAAENLKNYVMNPDIWKLNTGLKSAFKTRNEIMLDCDSYYMIRNDSTGWMEVKPFLEEKGYIV